MDEFSLIQKIIIWAIPVLFAVTLHEVAHGWVALHFGDRTAQMLGRLTLNPIKHIDPVGTIIVPSLLAMTTGFIFGWAKPVPVNARNMKNAKTSMAWVALAGPTANLLMALFWSVIVLVGLSGSEALAYMGLVGIFINTMLMLLNLLLSFINKFEFSFLLWWPHFNERIAWHFSLANESARTIRLYHFIGVALFWYYWDGVRASCLWVYKFITNTF